MCVCVCIDCAIPMIPASPYKHTNISNQMYMFERANKNIETIVLFCTVVECIEVYYSVGRQELKHEYPALIDTSSFY